MARSEAGGHPKMRRTGPPLSSTGLRSWRSGRIESPAVRNSAGWTEDLFYGQRSHAPLSALAAPVAVEAQSRAIESHAAAGDIVAGSHAIFACLPGQTEAFPGRAQAGPVARRENSPTAKGMRR